MNTKIPSNLSFGRTPKRFWIVDKTAEAINGDIFDIHEFRSFSGPISNIINLIISPYYALKIPKKEIYIVGAPAVMLALKIKRHIFYQKFKMIHFVKNDFYNRNRHKGLKRKFMDYLAKDVDGAIVPGEMIKKEIREKFNFPIEISYHFTKDDTYFKIKPDLKSRDVISIGIQPKLRKGTDIFYKVAKEMKNKKFYLLGEFNILEEDLKNKISNQKNITAPGFVPPKEYLEKSTFFLLPGRYDAGPIAITEALAAGLIPICSNSLGAQDLVKKLREDLVISSENPQDYINKLDELTNLPEKEIEKLSNKAKKIANDFNLENGKKDYRNKFLKLLKKIN